MDVINVPHRYDSGSRRWHFVSTIHTLRAIRDIPLLAGASCCFSSTFTPCCTSILQVELSEHLAQHNKKIIKSAPSHLAGSKII